MNNKNITEFLQEIVVGRFLINFVPGLILFYVLGTFVEFKTGEGLISFLIVTSVSWTLGVLLEFIFFRKTFFKRWQEGVSSNIENVFLLFGKIGMAVLIACVLWIDLKWILEFFRIRDEEEVAFITAIVKFILFLIGGVLLYLVYSKQAKKQ